MVNNLRGTQPAKLGLDYATLGRSTRRRVPAHLGIWPRQRARGLAGLRLPDAGRGGAHELTGEPDGPPARFGPSIIDYMTGPTSWSACWLHARARDRAGLRRETCLYDVAMHQLTYSGMWYLNDGDVSPAPAQRHLSLVRCRPSRLRTAGS